MSEASGTLRFGRSYHVALFYEALSYLDLKGDAASLYRPRKIIPSWVEPLRKAYQYELPHASALQGLPFQVLDLAALKQRLVTSKLTCYQIMASALSDLESEYHQEFGASASKDATRADELCRAISKILFDLRSALWRKINRSPSPLTVYHVPAMGRCGRGFGRSGQRAVAVSFNMPDDYLLCQIFHEETHWISDTAIEKKTIRTTQKNSSGYHIHRELEKRAVVLGYETIRSISPQSLSAYQSWMTSWGISDPFNRSKTELG